MALAPKVTRTASEVSLLVTSAVRIYIIVTLVEPLKEWWQGENEDEERKSKGAKRKLIMGIVIVAATVALEVGVKSLLSGEGMPSLFGSNA